MLTIYLRYFQKEHSYLLFPFYYAMSLLSFSLLTLLLYPSVYNFKYYTLRDIGLFTFSGIMNITMGTMRCYALTLEEASTLAPYSYVASLLLFLFDVFYFEYSFSCIELLGGSLTIFCLLTKLRENK